MCVECAGIGSSMTPINSLEELNFGILLGCVKKKNESEMLCGSDFPGSLSDWSIFQVNLNNLC